VTAFLFNRKNILFNRCYNLKKFIFALIFILFMITACSGTLPPGSDEIDQTKITTTDITANTEPETKTQTEEITEPVTVPVTEAPDPAELYIKQKISSMTLDEKVGQLFLVRCPEIRITETAAEYKFGGYVYFAVNFDKRSRSEVTDEIAGCQAVSDIPMLIAVDEEGGTVNRVSRYTEFRPSPFLSPRTLYNKGGLDLIKTDTAEKAELLLGLGINLNLAPVCDISVDPNDFMYARSVGLDAAGTSDYIRTVVDVMNKYYIGCSLKHFPGYGNNADTHLDVVYDNRTYESYLKNDFLPFIAGIEAGAGSVMVSHNIMTCVDSVYPSSLSVDVHKLLRNELNFDGVIMTDDLSMEGIRKYTNGTEAAVRAVEAGNDMLCCSDYEIQYPAVLEAVHSGRITVERIEESVARILRWKIQLKLIKL
jgi:beta-N-acetylhexosaminidase